MLKRIPQYRRGQTARRQRRRPSLRDRRHAGLCPRTAAADGRCATSLPGNGLYADPVLSLAYHGNNNDSAALLDGHSAEARRIETLIKFPHGLGDAAQLTSVLRHLAKHRPGWTIDVAAQVGKHTAFTGLCRRPLVLDRDAIDESRYRWVYDLGWWECYSVYHDSPCTKVCNCLREEFGIAPDLSLLKYRINVSDESLRVTRDYLASIRRAAGHDDAPATTDGAPAGSVHLRPCGQTKVGLGTASTNGAPLAEAAPCLPVTVRLPVVAIHYEGNTSVWKKNLSHDMAAALCRELIVHGYTPLILDWDGRSPLPDQEHIFCPRVGPGDLWHNTGTGDAEQLAALLSQCALVIGVDSGPLHVAGATQTPTLGVWKTHSPVQF